MDDTVLINLVVANWKRIGDILLDSDGCHSDRYHSDKYYEVVPRLLDAVLVSPFRLVANYCSTSGLYSQFDNTITTNHIIWNCWLMELGAVVQYEMLRNISGLRCDLELDILVSMEIGIELSCLRIELDEDVMIKLENWIKKWENNILSGLSEIGNGNDIDKIISDIV